MELRPLTREEWVAEALRCHADGYLPTICWDNVFVALCEEVKALREEIDGPPDNGSSAQPEES